MGRISHPGFALDVAAKPVAPEFIEVRLKWSGSNYHPIVINHTKEAQRLREAVLFVFGHGMPAETAVYGEGFQMLTQTTGTLASMKEIGYPEQKHYHIPGPSDTSVVTNLLILTPPAERSTLFAYTSSPGRFYLREGSVSAVIDMEGIELGPGESMGLETLVHWKGRDVSVLLDPLADRLNSAHPHRVTRPIPTGWCAWYCFERSTSSEVVQPRR